MSTSRNSDCLYRVESASVGAEERAALPALLHPVFLNPLFQPVKRVFLFPQCHHQPQGDQSKTQQHCFRGVGATLAQSHEAFFSRCAMAACMRWAASRKLSSEIMLYRSNTLRVRCPEISIATPSGIPARTQFRTAVRLRS